ncbi:MAG: acetyltransferase [Chloroflexota bacterium]
MTAIRIVLVGAGRFSEEVTDVALDAGFEVRGWIEGIDPSRADPRHEPPIIWVDDQARFEPDLRIVPAIGSVRRRPLVERLLAEGRELATVIHPSAIIARSAELEPGCVVLPNVVIGARTRIGAGTILNRGVLVGHHTTIGSGCFLGPGANVAGGIMIGDDVFLAIGSVVRDDRTIGTGALVGAGAVVVDDVEAGSVVMGVPARPVESRSDGVGRYQAPTSSRNQAS